MRELKTFVATRPQSKWVSDAKAQMQEIASPYFELTTPDVSLGEKRISGSLLSKNLKSVHFSLYNLNLKQLLIRPQDKNNSNWGNLNDWDGKISKLLKTSSAPIAQWDKALPDAGDYRPSTTSFDLPKIKHGTYLLVAKAGERTSYRVVIPSNLTLVQKTDHDNVLLFAANSHTGKPVSGATLTVKTWFYIGGKNECHSEIVIGKTNASGLFSVPRKSFSSRENQTTGAIAEYDGSSVFTYPQGFDDNDDGALGYKSYFTTDRSVYRPLQTVYYRNLVMQNRREGLKPLQGKKIHLVVTDPKGRKIHVAQRSSSEFGSLNGKFDLPADAPLGEYRIESKIGAKDGESPNETGNIFRVEEYKKPEFEVTVTPAAERVKIGEKTSATVKAAYYFGGPVPNAKVTYRIHRNYYSQSFAFPRQYDFLYGERSHNPDISFRNGAVIAQGTAVTDAKGEAKRASPDSPEVSAR